MVAQVDEDLEQPVLPSRTPEPTTRTVTFSDGALPGAEWESVVADAVRRIQAGDLEKVVLDPAAELAGAGAKFVPVRDALVARD